MKHVMVDLETLATTADACILSIGAVRFDLESDDVDDAGFYASISVTSNLHMDRRISEDTLIWWFDRPKEAQAVFSEKKQSLAQGLMNFRDWINDAECQIWSNGADFDLPILAHAFGQLRVDVPWKYWNANCYRTYKKLPGAKNLRVPPVGVLHNALSDAITQAKTVQLIHRTLFSSIKHAMVKGTT